MTWAPTWARRKKKKKRLWFSIETRLAETRLDIDPTASFLAGTRAWRRTWGVEAPLLQAPVQALAPGKLLRRRRRRERGRGQLRAAGEGGGGRRRADRAVLGSREEPSRAYHGVSSHDVHRLVHEHLRGHERGDGDGADHRPASLEVHLAQDRGVHGHTAFRESHDARARSRDARGRLRPRAGFRRTTTKPLRTATRDVTRTRTVRFKRARQ